MRRRWTAAEDAYLREHFPHEPTAPIAAHLVRTLSTIYQRAYSLGLKKTADRLESAGRFRRGKRNAPATEFQAGGLPWNAGTHYDPGGRSVETRFKKGQWPANKDPDFYVLGALRVSADGYLEMRVSFEPGGKGWKGMHRVIWEDAHGPIPSGFALCFKDRDTLNVELENLELVSRGDLMRRNTIHRLPPEIVAVKQQIAGLTRRINKHDRKAAHGTHD